MTAIPDIKVIKKRDRKKDGGDIATDMRLDDEEKRCPRQINFSLTLTSLFHGLPNSENPTRPLFCLRFSPCPPTRQYTARVCLKGRHGSRAQDNKMIDELI